MRVDSPVDATQLAWTPQLFYVVTDRVPSVTDPDGRPVVQLNPPYDVDLYPADDLTAPQAAFRAPRTGTLLVTPALSIGGGAAAPTEVVFTVKRRGALTAKRVLTLEGGQLVNGGPLSVPVTRDEALVFDFSTRDTTLVSRLSGHGVTVRYADEADRDGTGGTPAPSALHVATTPGAFPQPYRGWAVIGYNGNRQRATQPIDEAGLVLTEDYRLDTARVYLFTPEPETRRWRGPDALAWVAADRVSSSRLGLDDIDVPRSQDFAGARAVRRLSRATQVGLGGGGALPISSRLSLDGSASVAVGTSTSEVDFLDLNGDGFPDILGQGRVQYTEMTGGLEAGNRAIAGLGKVRDSQNRSVTVGLGGSLSRNKPDAKGNTGARGGSGSGGVTADQGPEMPPLGFSGNLGVGDSDVTSDLLDVNGDGLPDRVFKDGRVALNLGYGFAPAETWGVGAINASDSRNGSLGLSASFNDGIYGWGGGLSLSRGDSGSRRTLLDVNGDGLLDVVTGSGPSLQVQVNTGAGFAPPVPWTGGLARGLADNTTTTQGGGVYFTVSIPLPPCPCSIILNPGLNANTSMARQETAVRDLNGDGYPDYLASNADGRLTVALNRTGRTNLLKAVSRPLGATMAFSYL